MLEWNKELDKTIWFIYSGIIYIFTVEQYNITHKTWLTDRNECAKDRGSEKQFSLERPSLKLSRQIKCLYNHNYNILAKDLSTILAL